MGETPSSPFSVRVRRNLPFFPPCFFFHLIPTRPDPDLTPDPNPDPIWSMGPRDPSPGREINGACCYPEAEVEQSGSDGGATAPAGAGAGANSLSSSLSLCLVNRNRNWVVSFNRVFFYSLIFTCISSVWYAISLWKRTAALEGEIIKLHRLCKGNDSIYHVSIEALQSRDDKPSYSFVNVNSKTMAFYTVIFTILLPFVVYKYVDYLPRLKSLSKRTQIYKEEVPPKKKIAYMVDVCFSVYPYAKLLALLFSTVFLIGFGGLALYAVSDSSLAVALWLSWTFVADSGNHAERVGTGPRIVSVSISAGGMLIFAMMLGIVSDAISEKVDSLRKGRSEVIESNHVLILGWSDKLVSVSKARAIIVLASDENFDQSDARALRVVLSLTGVKEGLRGHVVVELSDLDNEPLVKLVCGGTC